MANAAMEPGEEHRGMPTRHAEGGAASVLELLLIVACLAALFLPALPAAGRLHGRWSLYCGAYAVESSLQWGRLQAVSANTALALEVNSNGTAICWQDFDTGRIYEGSIRELPGGVRIVASPARPLRFFPQGNAAPAGSYVIQGDRGSYRVVVNIAGRIRVEKL